MYRLFGIKKDAAGPTPTLGEAAQGLNQRQEDLDKKINQLNAELLRYKNQMKNAKGSARQSLQRRCAQVLQRRKVYMQQRDMTANQMFNVDQTAFQLESIKGTQQMVAAMKSASVTLKAEAGKLDLDEIENMQGDLEDMFEDMEEVNDIMGQSYATDDFIGDDELMAELDCLEDDLETEDYSLPSFLQPMPEAPAAAIVADGSEETTTATSETTPSAPSAQGVDAYGLPP